MTFWEGVGLLIVRVVNGVDDVALVGAELVTARFHVPRIQKLLLATFAGVVVLHLNLHYPCMVQVFGVPVHTEVESKAFRAAEIRNPEEHGTVLVLHAFLVYDLRVVTTLNRKVNPRSAVCTMLHAFPRKFGTRS